MLDDMPKSHSGALVAHAQDAIAGFTGRSPAKAERRSRRGAR